MNLSVNLSSFRMKVRRYDHSENPPILHRKETFVGADYPHREKFAKFTTQEERWGLLDEPSRIGLKNGWNDKSESVSNNGGIISGDSLCNCFGRYRHGASPPILAFSGLWFCLAKAPMGKRSISRCFGTSWVKKTAQRIHCSHSLRIVLRAQGFSAS